MATNRPIVLCFSGHDPSGGAGLQADCEALISHGCHASSVITALTEQDTHNVKKLIPQSPQAIINQAQTLLADLPVQVFKIGLIGHVETALAIHEIISQYPNIPVVLDPVLAAGGGTVLATEALIEVILTKLLPLTTVLTPNTDEARQLTGLDDLNACGLRLLEYGCDYALLTGTGEPTEHVRNSLYYQEKLWESYTWERLANSYHGSGCTLSASIAGLMAQGLSPMPAITEAQEYTWNTLKHAYRTGTGQLNPNRFFWTEIE
ncbi:MAG: hydroxymethylpyrimidine/phosphomethylpyrimidine kinase [Methylococcaceae bacterium]